MHDPASTRRLAALRRALGDLAGGAVDGAAPTPVAGELAAVAVPSEERDRYAPVVSPGVRRWSTGVVALAIAAAVAIFVWRAAPHRHPAAASPRAAAGAGASRPVSGR